MIEFSLITELCESHLIPSRSSLQKWDEKPLRELAYMYFLALRILLADAETAKWAQHYAEKTAHTGNFEQWRTDGNDLYVLLYALSSDEHCSISPSSVRDWLRHTLSNDFDARTHKLFNRLDGMFHVSKSALKILRREIAHWTEIEARERDAAIVKIIQHIRRLAPNSELLGHLKQISKQFDDDDIKESASAGATSAASVATVSGGIGAGFAPDETWRGIYAKPKDKAKKPLVILKR